MAWFVWLAVNSVVEVADSDIGSPLDTEYFTVAES